MKIPKRPTDPKEFILEEHRALAEPPKFFVRPMTDGEYVLFNDIVHSGKPATALVGACESCVVGWENLEEEYSNKSVLSLPPEWKILIGRFASDISVLSETEKN